MVRLQIDRATSWQRIGGKVRFTLSGPGIPNPALQVFVCFRWHETTKSPPRYLNTPFPLQLIAVGPRTAATATGTATYAVIVPRKLRNAAPGWSNRKKYDWTGFDLVPLADMHVVVMNTGANTPIPSNGDTGAGASVHGNDPAIPAVAPAGWQRAEFVRQIGITKWWCAALGAAVVLAVAWALFVLWGRSFGIRGGLILSVISTYDGRASLSQFQIIVWTLLMATGLTYVMLLSGNLIDIPPTALVLLGISGATTVGAKLKASGSRMYRSRNAPGATTCLEQLGAATASTVTLTWKPPLPADPTAAFTLQMRRSGTLPWSTVSTTIAAPPFTVMGLETSRAYQLQVFASNAVGSGPASPLLEVTTACVAEPNPSAPAPVTGLQSAPGQRPQTDVRLTWAMPTPVPSAHVVQYRRAGDAAWSTATGGATTPYTVTGLEPGTDYEFQVFAMNDGIAGQPSAVIGQPTAPREPQWADLLVTADGSAEVDVTRLQMLLFTVIAAVFVALNLFYQERIPDIPSGILILMGISNGVYMGAKFGSFPR